MENSKQDEFGDGLPNQTFNDILRIGDYISLYCQEAEGYVFGYQTSNSHNTLNIYHRQDPICPENIPNVHCVTFQICIQNRYKLNKKYMKIKEQLKNDADNLHLIGTVLQAQKAAEAETEDNFCEERRQCGSKVRYGTIIQLRHCFTEKYIHASTTETSKRDKNNMKVTLEKYNAKHAHFYLLPRYKVKSEGELIQIQDQIILESVKCRGQYLHASSIFTIDHVIGRGSELNLAVDHTGFTIYRHASWEAVPKQKINYEINDETEFELIRGGSLVRLFHKDLEAYVVAEGLFNVSIIEPVHLRIRPIDQMIAKSLYPSTSALTYFQIEHECSILNGDPICWQTQIRLRHYVTRLYLRIRLDAQIDLTDNGRDPLTVFRLHPLMTDADEMRFESYARIEHVLSGNWLHANRDKIYEKKNWQLENQQETSTMSWLKWDGAELREISVSDERIYNDAYTLQKVDEKLIKEANFVAGQVPYLCKLIRDLEARIPKADETSFLTGSNTSLSSLKDPKILNVKRTRELTSALSELEEFMLIDKQPIKRRQKLLRNFRIIDLLVKILRLPLNDADMVDNELLDRLTRSNYAVLHTYMKGNSRKNALYFAKYIDFFQTRFNQVGDIGLNVAQMIVELIRDNREIVDRISRKQIDKFLECVRKFGNYRFLDLLNVLCVCNGVGISNNQTYITEKWLVNDNRGVYLTDRGQNIKLQTNIVYITKNLKGNWIPLHDFVNPNSECYDEEETKFLFHQLDLFRKLCHGRNEYAIKIITKDLKYISWEEAFLCVRLDILPAELRAKYCDLIIGLFVDVGNNYPILDAPNLSFVYDDIDIREPFEVSVGSSSSDNNIIAQPENKSQLVVKDLVTIFPVLRDWIMEVLDNHDHFIASNTGYNTLIEQIIKLLELLVKFGYYGADRDVKDLEKPLLNLLSGRKDVPFPVEKTTDNTTAKNLLKTYMNKTRYETSAENSIIVDVKFQVLQVLELLLNYQFNTRLKYFVAMFKRVERNLTNKQQQQQQQQQSGGVLQLLTLPNYDPIEQSKKCVKEQKKIQKILKDAFLKTSYFDAKRLTDALLDLSKYDYDKVVSKSLSVLNKFFSSGSDTFKAAMESQILLTNDSVRVHRDFIAYLPILRSLSRSKINSKQVDITVEVLDNLISICKLPYDANQRHSINQNILLNHGILSVIFDTLNFQRIDAGLVDDYKDTIMVVEKLLELLSVLTADNELVQKRVFDRMDVLLKIESIENKVAATLRNAFVNNRQNCLKITPKHLERIIGLITILNKKATEYIRLLTTIVRGGGDIFDLPLKRNQSYIIKYIVRNYSRIAKNIEKARSNFQEIIDNEDKKDDHFPQQQQQQQLDNPGRIYNLRFIELLATCADGENKFIENFCQSVLPLHEIVNVLKSEYLNPIVKQYYILFAHNVYLKTSSSIVETGADNLSHDSNLWEFFNSLVIECKSVSEYCQRNEENNLEDLLKMKPEIENNCNFDDEFNQCAISVYFLLNYAMPFLRTFFSKFYSKDVDSYPEEGDIITELGLSLWSFVKSIKKYVKNPQYLRVIVSCLTTILSSTKTFIAKELDDFLECLLQSENLFSDFECNKIGHERHYQSEIELNETFKRFSFNASLVYGGQNTVASQLKLPFKQFRQQAYIDTTGYEVLPLGDEFQEHVNCFINPNEKTIPKEIAPCSLIIKQLGISACDIRMSETAKVEQLELDVKCLQLLRAVMHNEIVKLPENYDNNLKSKRQLQRIRQIQCHLCEMGAIIKVLPLLGNCNDDLTRETLAFLSALLFHANDIVQQKMIEYFRATREEVFFLAVRNRMQLSVNSIKENKSLENSNNNNNNNNNNNSPINKMNSNRRKTNDFKRSISKGRDALNKIERYENSMKINKIRSSGTRRRVSFALQNSSSSIPPPPLPINHESKDLVKVQVEEDVVQLEEINSAGMDKTSEIIITHESQPLIKDEGFIDLVLKILAQMCDGQYVELQNYLREQPDNIKSFNLIAETASFLSIIYSRITIANIDLVIQLFESLNEFASGNQNNRAVLVTNKVVDYANFILRASNLQNQMQDCPSSKIIQLKSAIVNLIYSLIEENGKESLVVANEVMDSIDKEALYKIATDCYWDSQDNYAEIRQLLKFNCWNSCKAIKQSCNVIIYRLKGYGNELIHGRQRTIQDDMLDLGFSYYIITARLNDVSALKYRRSVSQQIHLENSNWQQFDSNRRKAFDYYRRNTTSIEILKNDELQKIHFRVRNQEVLREQIKEKLKWNVDRSSPSNKIRDLMNWSKDILDDIYYQRKLLANWLAAFVSRHWLAWNRGVVLLSLAINLLMLISWRAKFSLIELNSTAVALPAELFDPVPVMKISNFYGLLYILGGCHTAFCIILLISYLLSNHPKLPKFTWLRKKCFVSRKEKKNSDNKQKTADYSFKIKRKKYTSKLEAHVISLSTFYYLTLIGFSIGGTYYHGYFFAFHLLNIVNNNQLLIGVIQAVTQNGRSLIWVAILGLIMFYLYAVVGFALFRDLFKPDQNLYCATLWQCTVTMIRYGLVGDYAEVMQRHSLHNTFTNFAYLAIYEVSFFIFITTIGLNIIFGIIVDTFSELRDLKWTAERDMRDTCFICSRQSYDFEHHGLGFSYHVQRDHNMWAYIFFFIHLHDTKTTDYTALDLYVSKLLRRDIYVFFPLNRALSLMTVDDDSTESKIDELLDNVSNLVSKQKANDVEKKRMKEWASQRKWHERHRHMTVSHRQQRIESRPSRIHPKEMKAYEFHEGTYL